MGGTAGNPDSWEFRW